MSFAFTYFWGNVSLFFFCIMSDNFFASSPLLMLGIRHVLPVGLANSRNCCCPVKLGAKSPTATC